MDDDLFATIVYPRLTTIRVDVGEKAETAVNVLVKLIHGEKCEKNVYMTGVQLVERDSVKIKPSKRLRSTGIGKVTKAKIVYF